MRAFVVAALAIAVVAPAGADGAREGFPGRNGLVVFASDRAIPSSPEIYAAAVDGGAPRNLTRSQGWDSGPLPSPDGRWIAFRAEGLGITLMRSDGSGRRALVDGESPSWSPDSRSLAFADLRGRIAVVDVETAAVRTLAEGHLPAWSPDGRHIAFHRGPRLHVVRAEGGEVRHLAQGMVLSGVLARPPAWSPDGSRLAFAGGEDDGNGFARMSEIHVVRVADGVSTQLTRGGGAKAGPRFAPDGRTIVFMENHPTEPKTELVLVGADGSGRRLLTRGARFSYDLNPSWSPDGAWIGFTRGPADTVATGVLAVRRDGSGLRRLTQPRSGVPAYEGPEWLRDGRTVVFARSSSDRDTDIHTVDPRDGRLRKLTDNVVPDRDPAWSPDGSRIAFVRTFFSGPRGREHYNEELFVMRADGSGVRRLTHHRSEDLRRRGRRTAAASSSPVGSTAAG